MPNMRPFLIVAILVTLYFLWDAWQRDYGPQPATSPTASATSDSTSSTGAIDGPAAPAVRDDADVPNAPSTTVAGIAEAPAPKAASEATTSRITVETDVLRLVIDTRGGTVVSAELLDYPIDPKRPEPVVRLLDDTPERFFVAQSGLVGAAGGPVAPDHRAVFSAERDSFRFEEGRQTLEVPLTWTGPDGLSVTRTLIFTRGSYAISQRTVVSNASSAPWTGSEYRQLQRVAPVRAGGFSFTDPEQYAFVGASWYSPENRFEKLKFDNFRTEPLNRSFAGGWAAMQQHYFVAAWLPPVAELTQYSTAVLEGPRAPRYLIRLMSPAVTVAPGASATFESRLYVGPKLQAQLREVADGLVYTVDYGLVTFIAAPLFWVLKQLHALVGNWGVAIILLTILVKAAFFKLTEAQYRSFAKMRKVAPRLQALKERYGDDRQKLNQAMMELYQKEKINPLGGCLPILVQMPVFIALYWVLLESVELRQAVFIPGWIDNISAKDPFFILPVLNGIAMYVSQKLTPTTGMDPMQARMLQLMPIIFAVMFAFFPAGLVLYWTVNSTLSLAQQWYITRKIEASEKA
jgi:YidC/Oxa1 family membrane protein insertase